MQIFTYVAADASGLHTCVWVYAPTREQADAALQGKNATYSHERSVEDSLVLALTAADDIDYWVAP